MAPTTKSVKQCSLSRRKAWMGAVAMGLSAGLYLFIAMSNRAADALWIQSASAALAALYLILTLRMPWSLPRLLATGLLLRAMLFISAPVLSDDYYRFFWDGLLLHQGEHPMLHPPMAYNDSVCTDTQQHLRKHMNSPHYLSPYPSMHQAVFYIATLNYKSLRWSIFWMRCMHLLADVASCLLLAICLRERGKPSGLAALYFLHPMVILEGVGNLHFEPYVVAFLLLGCWGLGRKYWIITGAALAFAVATKLLALLLLPFMSVWLWRHHGHASSLRFLSSFFVCSLLLFAPLWHPELWRVSESLGLYFQKFEFNASLYFLFSGLIHLISNQHPIEWLGPMLAGLALISMLLLTGRLTKKNTPATPPTGMLVLLVLYFLCTTTLHPWYLIPVLGLAVLSGWYTPLLWGYVALWSYIGYTAESYTHPYGWIAWGYALVGISTLLEWIKKHKETSLSYG